MPASTLTFDLCHGMAYVYAPGRKSKKGVVARTQQVEIFREGEVATTVYVDYDHEDRVFGVETLNLQVITLAEILQFFKERPAGSEKKKS